MYFILEAINYYYYYYMTQKDNGPGPGRNYGETGVFTFGRKVVFGLKMGLTPKNHPK